MGKGNDTIMEKYVYTIIEEWWRHNGTWDRYCASHIQKEDDEQVEDYISRTDDWWGTLTDEQKVELYNEFFSEE